MVGGWVTLYRFVCSCSKPHWCARRWLVVVAFDAHSLLVVVFFEVGLERDGQRERCDAGVRCLADNRRTAQLLQREAKVAV